jgi:hypothetical protein
MGRAGAVAFVDPALPDLSRLLGWFRDDVRAVVLDTTSDPLRQIAEGLVGLTGLRAIHILAHGAPGEIGFSIGALSLESVSANASNLARIGAAVDNGGELLVWACETGRGERGEQFIEALWWATGANVAASSQTIGAARLGGCWELDVRLGAKRVLPPVTADGLAAYPHLLALNTWKGTGSTTNPKSGNWGTGSNWSTGKTPASGDDVILPPSGTKGTYTVALNVTSTPALDSLVINGGATLAISANALSVLGTGTGATDAVTITSGGSLTVAGGTITSLAFRLSGIVSGFGTIAANLSGIGIVTASGGTLTLAGTVISGPIFTISSTTASGLKFTGTANVATPIGINSANQTLEIGDGGNLTIGAIESITNGKILLSGGILNDQAGVTIGSGAILAGQGVVTANLSGNGFIAASGGTLTLSGTVSGGPTLLIDPTRPSDLKFVGRATTATPIWIGNANQTLEIGAPGSLTIAAAQTVTAGKILLTGGTLTDGAGLTLGNSGTLTGFGMLNADLSGTGRVMAANGTLDLTGNVSSGLTLSIADVANSTLKIDGTVTTGSIAIDSGNKTLEIGVSGKSLTFTAAESVNNGGAIRLDGGSLADVAASGITIGPGGALIGRGSVTGALGGSGTIEASSGMLDLSGASIAATATGLEIANDRSTLVVNHVAKGANASFLGSNGTLKILHVGDFLGTISGLATGHGLTPSNDVDLADVGTITRSTISGNTVTFFNGNSQVAQLTLGSAPGAGSYADWISDGNGGTEVFLSDVPCFCRGTMIRTERGEVAVEDLKVGDLVDTLFRGFQPIRWIGFGRTLVTAANCELVRPIIVCRGALGENEPCRDLNLTRGHSLLIEDQLVPVDLLVNYRTILWDDRARVVEYYHIELDEHDVLFADGTLAESYIEDGNRVLFQNSRDRSGEPPMRWLAPVLTKGPELDRIWAKLVERAGGPIEVETTDDPDLHLLVDGQRLDPAAIEGQVYSFILKRQPGDLHIRSRSVIPAASGHCRDGRLLGVAISRLVLKQRGITIEIPYGADLFPEGAHGIEAGFRWTKGDLAFSPNLLAHIEEEANLEVHLMHRLQYPLPPPRSVTASM